VPQSLFCLREPRRLPQCVDWFSMIRFTYTDGVGSVCRQWTPRITVCARGPLPGCGRSRGVCLSQGGGGEGSTHGSPAPVLFSCKPAAQLVANLAAAGPLVAGLGARRGLLLGLGGLAQGLSSGRGHPPGGGRVSLRSGKKGPGPGLSATGIGFALCRGLPIALACAALAAPGPPRGPSDGRVKSWAPHASCAPATVLTIPAVGLRVGNRG